MSHRFAWILMLVLWFVFGALSGPSLGATEYEQGISDISLGRFAAWDLLDDQYFEFFEDDAIARVHPDKITKHHRLMGNDNWCIRFGSTDSNDSPALIGAFSGHVPIDPHIWPEAENWVFKEFGVLRTGLNGQDPRDQGGQATAPNYFGRNYTYTVSVNCLGPGVRIQTKYNMFYLVNGGHKLGYVNYQTSGGGSVVEGDYTREPISIDGRSLFENWVLLFDSESSNYQRHIPVMVSFSHHPTSIDCDSLYIKFLFADKDPDEEMTVFVSLPFGVDALDPWTTGSWVFDGHLPTGTLNHCRLINRLVNQWPVAVSEKFRFETDDPSPPRVLIKNQFSYDYMGAAWASNGYVPETPYALVPPVLKLAEGDVDITIPSRYMPGVEDEDVQFPTKNGPL